MKKMFVIVAILAATDFSRAQDALAPLERNPVPHDLSPWSMFLAADVILKGVMIGLTLASLTTWTIFIAKTIEVTRAKRALTQALARIQTATTVSQALELQQNERDPLSNFLFAALEEENLFMASGAKRYGLERAASKFSEIVQAQRRSMRAGMGALATIGSTAPFVGLFGTVWGVMNSFISISKSQTTNLAVVAPGIAEALFATATGLAAAVPAVVIYNIFTRKTNAYMDIVQQACGAALRLLSRDLECVKTPPFLHEDG